MFIAMLVYKCNGNAYINVKEMLYKYYKIITENEKGFIISKKCGKMIVY